MCKPKDPSFPISELQEIWEYERETGLFRWIKAGRGRRVGAVTGFKDGAGDRYIFLTWKGRKIYAHRLAFAFVTGGWPRQVIDHINGVKTDNRWANLREATQAQNKK